MPRSRLRGADVALLLFGREELPAQFSPLPELFEHSRLVREASLAILLEPTAGAIQAGCVGNLNARVTFHGVSGHSARPWLAENAIHKALAALAPVAALERREVVISGLAVLRGRLGDADRGRDRRQRRPRPRDRDAQLPLHARSHERGGGGVPPLARPGRRSTIELSGDSPPARVVADAPLVQALRLAGDLPLEPKQAWTNVADFTTRGIDAVNFGPGDPRFAHRRDEQVEISALVRCYETLRAFVTGS